MACISLLLPVVAFSPPSGTAASFAITEQTVEYLTNPLGVDVTPRFSWKVVPITDVPRGRSPTAYQLTVKHSSNSSVVWDSGKVSSNATHHVSYGGAALVSDARYSWAVSSFLDDGSKIDSSAAATFGTALLSASDWKASWITGGDAARLLRKKFSAGAVTSHATLFVAGIGYSEVTMRASRAFHSSRINRRSRAIHA